MSQAARYNKDKPQYSLIDLTALEPCARVLEFGAKKYARDNWKKGMPVTQILDSLLRHLGALRSGELIDPESGLPHIGHIQCNAMFLGNPNNAQDITLEVTNCGHKTQKEVLEQLADDKAAMSIHLGPEATKQFLEVLDNPPKAVPVLKRLFTGLCPHDVSKYKEYLDDKDS